MQLSFLSAKRGMRFSFSYFYRLESISKWTECWHAWYLKNQSETCKVVRSNCWMLQLKKKTHKRILKSPRGVTEEGGMLAICSSSEQKLCFAWVQTLWTWRWNLSPPGADKTKIVRDHTTRRGLPGAKHGCLFSLFQGCFRVSKQGSLGFLVTILFYSHRRCQLGLALLAETACRTCTEAGKHIVALQRRIWWISVCFQSVCRQKQKKTCFFPFEKICSL